MLSRIGISKNFFSNPFTMLFIMLLAAASISALDADKRWSSACAAITYVVIGAQGFDEYFVQPLENVTYEECFGRIPEDLVDWWPLTDCSPGGRPHYSGGATMRAAQKCRFNTGGRQVF